MKKWIILLFALLLLLGGCEKKPVTPSGCDIQEGCDGEGEKADMSAYEYYAESEDYVFLKSSVKEMAQMMEDQRSFVIYFGFSRCPWCRDAMPILNEAAKKSGFLGVYYVNTREKEEWKSNIDIDDYDTFVELVGDYLEYDDNGIKHLYTPFVIFVKEGKVVATVSAPDYDAHEEAIPEELREELLNTYIEAFSKVR